MDSEEPRLLNAAEVADRLGVCRTKVYGGCKVIAGRVSNEIFEETFFNPKGGARHNR